MSKLSTYCTSHTRAVSVPITSPVTNRFWITWGGAIAINSAVGVVLYLHFDPKLLFVFNALFYGLAGALLSSLYVEKDQPRRDSFGLPERLQLPGPDRDRQDQPCFDTPKTDEATALVHKLEQLRILISRLRVIVSSESGSTDSLEQGCLTFEESIEALRETIYTVDEMLDGFRSLHTPVPRYSGPSKNSNTPQFIQLKLNKLWVDLRMLEQAVESLGELALRDNHNELDLKEYLLQLQTLVDAHVEIEDL